MHKKSWDQQVEMLEIKDNYQTENMEEAVAEEKQEEEVEEELSKILTVSWEDQHTKCPAVFKGYSWMFFVLSGLCYCQSDKCPALDNDIDFTF